MPSSRSKYPFRTGVLVLLVLACASQSRLAPIVEASDVVGPSDVAQSMVVPYPPPPAKVETMPPAPSSGACAYLDGQWIFGARDWQWVPGAWVFAQKGCAFARSRLFWQSAGADRSELRFRAGRWVQSTHPDLDCPPATPCSSSVSPLP